MKILAIGEEVYLNQDYKMIWKIVDCRLEWNKKVSYAIQSGYATTRVWAKNLESVKTYLRQKKLERILDA